MDGLAGWQAKDVIVVSSSLASLVGIWLTHLFTRSRVGPDKVWNLKLETYNQIVQAVSEAETSFRAVRRLLKAVPDRTKNVSNVVEPDAVEPDVPESADVDAALELAEGLAKLDRMWDLINANRLICSRKVSGAGTALYYSLVVEKCLDEPGITPDDLAPVIEDLSWWGRKLISLGKAELGLVDNRPQFMRIRPLILRFKYRHWIADVMAKRENE
jgi:hypothetical protein